MKTFLSKNRKIIAIFSVIVLILLVAITMQFNDKNNDGKTKGDAPDPAFIFYRDLGVNFRDCGSEDFKLGFGYNRDMRACFEGAYTTCTEAKLHQKIYTIEGDPIFTTLAIEGDAPRGCAVHIYIDNRDRFGPSGALDTICYTTTFDTSSGLDSILLTECEDGTERYFY